MLKKDLQQYSYRVETKQHCIVTVEAYSQKEADRRVEDSSTWVDEQVVDFVDFTVKGPA